MYFHPCKSISQSLGYSSQGLVYSSQSLGYLSQTLGYRISAGKNKFYGRGNNLLRQASGTSAQRIAYRQFPYSGNQNAPKQKKREQPPIKAIYSLLTRNTTFILY